jgi:3-deoxy-D-manno-octulosonic-acid transferase
VGGSLVDHGGQNPLEPARLGVPVLHGPHVFNFAGEYDELGAAGAAHTVADADALAARAAHWLAAPEEAAAAGKAAQAIAERGAGALDRAKAALAPVLEKAGFDAPA